MENVPIGFPKIDVTRKTGSEPIHRSGEATGNQLFGFWQWSSSDLLSNATRGILAEYIVACALGIADGVRAEWDAYDLLTSSGLRIEVKSAAYLQSWYHRELSRISFSIRPTRNWDAATNILAEDLRRQGDIYVFCVLNHKDKATVDPLNVDQWDFYVLSARTLNDRFPIQKAIALSSLLRLHPIKSTFHNLGEVVSDHAPL